MADEHRSPNRETLPRIARRPPAQAASAASIARATLPTIVSGLRKLGERAARRATAYVAFQGRRGQCRATSHRIPDPVFLAWLRVTNCN